MGGVTTRPVFRFGAAPSSPSQSLLSIGDVAYDYAIGGLPFFSAADGNHPLVRQTAPYRKEQFDTSTEPGEQSMVNWWLRSQDSFHAGTGIIFEEPDPNDATIQYRFRDSAGVDVWTPGRVKLLKATTLTKASTGTALLTATNDGGGTDVYLQSDGTALYRVTVAGVSTTVTWGGAGTIVSLSNDGVNYYAADSVGIWQGTMAGGAGAKIWNTGSANTCVRWVKQRLVAGIANSFYELTGVGPALPVAKYTHPSTSWKFTAIAESPTAIFAAGSSGNQSAILKFVLDSSGDVPTLTSGIVTATLPRGEIVTGMETYLGSYVLIGTNRGVRVASVDVNGDLSYGPLSVDFTNTDLFPNGSPGPVYDFASKDRYIFFTLTNGINGSSGIGRIDMATQTAFHRWAWASDLQAHVTGTVRAVRLVGTSNRVVFAVDASGSYLEHATHLESTGYLKTGNIRYHTLEPKLFKFLRLRGSVLTGSIQASVFEPDGTEFTSALLDATSINEEIALSPDIGPQEYVDLLLTLNADAGLLTGPELRAYQLKALPATKRQRLIVLPLLCFDVERDKFGTSAGYEGSALTRLEALEALEEAGDLVILQDFSRYPQAARLCVIDDLKFVQASSPKNASGWGGLIEVTLRAVT